MKTLHFILMMACTIGLATAQQGKINIEQDQKRNTVHTQYI